MGSFPSSQRQLLQATMQELAAMYAADPEANNVANLRAAKALIARQGKCILDMLTFLANEKKKIDTSNSQSETFIKRQLEISDMISSFNVTGGQADNKTWLSHAESAKECIGPKAVSVRLLEAAVEVSKLSVDYAYQKHGRNSKKASVGLVKFQLQKQVDKLERARGDLANAQRRLEVVRLAVAERVGHRLVSDITKYEAALQDLVEDNPEDYRALTQLVRSVGNFGPLKKHSLVHVEIAGALAKGRVEEEVLEGDTEVTVSLWKRVYITKQPYEEGYETSDSLIDQFPRDQVIAGDDTKITQTVTEATVKSASRRGNNSALTAELIRDPKRPEFLVGLYCDAAASRDRVLELAEAAKRHVAKANITDEDGFQMKLGASVPGLKGMPRACVKTAEKYRGCYSYMTDLCRMTFVCSTVKMAFIVVKFIADHRGWSVVRIKDRLDPVFDASVTGGYRDLLMNARDEANGHIVELQLTFKEFYEIKTRGGHAIYKLARLLELNEKETTHFEGQPTAETLERISKGILRSLSFNTVTPAIHDALLSKHGLLSPTCAVTQYMVERLELHKTDFDYVLPLRMLQHIGQNLTHLKFDICRINGRIPEIIGEHCVNLRSLHLIANSISGEIPQNFLNLKKLQSLKMSRNKMSGDMFFLLQLKRLQTLSLFKNPGLSGSIPAEYLGKCTKLQDVDLSTTEIAGPIPDTIGNCTQLRIFFLFSTKVSGAIPATIGNCEMLQKLSLFKTEVSGAIPESIGKCGQLQLLVLSDTKISGQIPKSIGQCSHLQNLNLHDTKITGSIPKSITNCPELHKLSLFKTEISGTIPENIGRCASLKTLWLYRTKISGSLPQSLAECTELEFLECNNSPISGPIPEGIGNCTKLKKINLHDTKISGPLPNSIGECTQLTKVWLYKTGVSGCLPQTIGNCRRLENLELSNTQIEGAIPESIGNCVSMQKLNMYSTNLSGPIPKSIGNLVNMHTLWLNGTNISGPIPDSIGNCTKLRDLNMHSSSLSGAIPQSIGNCTLLENLNLNSTEVSGMIPESIGQCTQLQKLNLHTTKLTGGIPDSIENCRDLQMIWLYRTNLTGGIPEGIRKCKQLVNLELSNTQISGALPVNIGECTRLQKLNLYNTKISGGIPHSIEHCAALHTVWLNGTKISGAIPDNIGNCANLKDLNLNKTSISGAIPESIGNCSQLENLDLNNTQISGAIPESIGKCKKLQKINLHHTKLSGGLPESIGDMTELAKVWIYTTSLSGSLPESIVKCKRLENLELSNCKISGHLPVSLGQCISMVKLNLRDTHISGPIPDSIGQLTRLETLWLYRTKLSGPIPESIGNCTKLKDVALYETKISGPIPNSIGNCKQMQKLRLNDTKLTGVVPPCIAELTELTHLCLDKTKVTRPKKAKKHSMRVEADADAMRKFLEIFKES